MKNFGEVKLGPFEESDHKKTKMPLAITYDNSKNERKVFITILILVEVKDL